MTVNNKVHTCIYVFQSGIGRFGGGEPPVDQVFPKHLAEGGLVPLTGFAYLQRILDHPLRLPSHVKRIRQQNLWLLVIIVAMVPTGWKENSAIFSLLLVVQSSDKKSIWK